jgi:bifunctional non-homologous end joining protein LigD
MDPKDLTIEQRKAKREGRVFVDWMRNALSQTAVAPYSLRARPGAPAAIPLDWTEVENPRLKPDGFGYKAAVKRAGGEDPWKGWRRRARGLGAARKRLDALIDARDDG